MAKGYKINRSNYTIRRRHQLVKDGQVTERDFMTTTNLGQWDSGSIPYGESNFRMFYRNPENVRKKNVAGTWLKSGCSGETDEFWNTGCIGKTSVTEEKLIREKPNYKSLLDFAYFGSCTELVKSTIRKIVEEFPGEVNVYTKEPFNINGTEYYLVNNPFEVDLFDENVSDDIKKFAENFLEYELVESGNVYQIESVSVENVNLHACEHGDVIRTVTIVYESGTTVISEIIYDTEPMLFTLSDDDIRIHPRSVYLEEFFENLDDFGKMLLNRNSNPIYTATVDWPHETDYGVMTYEKSFTWPVDEHGWNLDISSTDYSQYVTDLLSLADFYDEKYTDNLWRMLTHDSIKSMDLAFSNPEKDEDKEDYNIGTTRLQGLLWAFGRQFDDIKRSIDNIKRTSTVTYDENGNMPDYFLSDALELDGWEVYNADTGIEHSGVTVDWGTIENEYSSEKANDTFLRELKLNSKNIFSKKGTVDGIVSLLGLFGMVSGVDYTITEHVAVVNRQIEKVETGDTAFTLAKLNEDKATSETDFPDDYNIFDGIPFTYVISGDYKYVIPWFDKNLKYDGGTYFQMNGGWMENKDSYVIDGDIPTNYDETIKFLSVVDSMKDMYSLPAAKRRVNAICYVENIDGTSDNVTSHYFKLKDPKNFDIAEGWTSCSESEIAYIDKIVDDYKGNNPHVGYGNYDNGKEYLDRIRYPFKPTEYFSDGAYDCNGNLNPDYGKEWVGIDIQDDNKKVWFFGNVSGGTLSTDYQTFDFMTGEEGSGTTEPSESSADSVINLKTVDFEFFTLSGFTDDFEHYLKNVVFPYMKQMIPSTAICTVKISSRDMLPFSVDTQAMNPYTLEVDGIAFANGDTDSRDDFITNYNEGNWIN